MHCCSCLRSLPVEVDRPYPVDLELVLSYEVEYKWNVRSYHWHVVTLLRINHSWLDDRPCLMLRFEFGCLIFCGVERVKVFYLEERQY